MMNLLSEEKSLLLASRNIVTIRQGSGTYISSSPGMMDDPLGFTFIGNKQKLINDLLEVRFLLEPPIAAHDPLRAQDAMYLHLVYNRKRIQMTGKGDFT